MTTDFKKAVVYTPAALAEFLELADHIKVSIVSFSNIPKIWLDYEPNWNSLDMPVALMLNTPVYITGGMVSYLVMIDKTEIPFILEPQ